MVSQSPGNSNNQLDSCLLLLYSYVKAYKGRVIRIFDEQKENCLTDKWQQSIRSLTKIRQWQLSFPLIFEVSKLTKRPVRRSLKFG